MLPKRELRLVNSTYFAHDLLPSIEPSIEWESMESAPGNGVEILCFTTHRDYDSSAMVDQSSSFVRAAALRSSAFSFAKS
jgi:hypothetical protein